MEVVKNSCLRLFTLLALTISIAFFYACTPPGPPGSNYIDRTYPAYMSGASVFDTMAYSSGVASDGLPNTRLEILYTEPMDVDSFYPTDDLVVEKCSPNHLAGTVCKIWDDVTLTDIIPNTSGTFFGGTWLSVYDASTVKSYVWDFTGCSEQDEEFYDRLTILLNNDYLTTLDPGTLLRFRFLPYTESFPDRGVNPINATQSVEGSIIFRIGQPETQLADLPYIAEFQPADLTGNPGSGIPTFPPHEEISIRTSETIHNFMPLLLHDGSPISGSCSFILMNQEGSAFTLSRDTRVRAWDTCGLEPNQELQLLMLSENGVWSALTTHPETCGGIGGAALGPFDLTSPVGQDLTGARMIAGGTITTSDNPTGRGVHNSVFLPPITNAPFDFAPTFKTSPVRIEASYNDTPLLTLFTYQTIKVSVATGATVTSVDSGILAPDDYADAGVGDYTCETISGNSTVCTPSITWVSDDATYIMRFTGLDGSTNKGFDQMTVRYVKDTDEDGMPDYFEMANSACLDYMDDSDAQIHSDSDGLTNLEEYQYSDQMDPCSDDSDGDGITDDDEISLVGTSPVLADTDSDGLDDGAEVALGTNPVASDSDLDGLPDGAEVCFDFDCENYTLNADTDPLNPDTDGDGLDDGFEVGLVSGETIIGSLTNPVKDDSDDDGQDDFSEYTIGNDPNRPDNADYYEISPNVVQPGWTVTLHGRRFGNSPTTDCQVHLNGEVITPESSSDNWALTFVVPAGAEENPWSDPQLYVTCDKNGLSYDSPDDLNIIVVDNSSSLLPYDENDTMEISASQFDTTFFGYIEDQNDLDSFLLSLPQGGVALISAVAIDPATGEDIESLQDLDLGLHIYSSGEAEVYQSEDESAENLNPAPIFAVLPEPDNYSLVLSGKDAETGFYRLRAEVKAVPFITGISPVLAAGGITLEITGVNFSDLIDDNEVVLVGPQAGPLDDYTCVITNYSHDQLVVTVPSAIAASPTGYEVKIKNLTSGFDTEDSWTLPYSHDYFFYPFTGSAPIIPDGQAGTTDLEFGVTGTAHTGPATGQFAFAALAGQAVKVHIQLVTDGGAAKETGIPELALLASDGNTIVGGATLDENDGILEVDFTGSRSLPVDGVYSLMVDYTGGSAYRIEVTDTTDLLGASAVTAVSESLTVVDPETESVTLTVQAMDGATALEVGGIPVVFVGPSQGFTLTDSVGQATMAVSPPAPGSFEHVLAYLATAPETKINFTILTRQRSSQQQGMMMMPTGSQIIGLELTTEPQAVAGETQNLTINAYEAMGGSVAGGTVTLTVASTSLGRFANGLQTLDVALPEDGETTVQFTPGSTISCTGCKTDLARRGTEDEEPAASIVGINEITAVVYDGVSKNITTSLTVEAFPGEAEHINIYRYSEINNSSFYVDMACCWSLDTTEMTALVTDHYSNLVANHEVLFESFNANNPDNALVLWSEASASGIMLPIHGDALPFSSSRLVPTDSVGAATIMWMLPRNTAAKAAKLQASLEDLSDTVFVEVTPLSISGVGNFLVDMKNWKTDTNPWLSNQVLPYLYTVRFFDIVYSGGIYVLQPHSTSGTATFNDYYKTGRLDTSPEMLNGTTHLTVTVDSHRQAQFYWKPVTASPYPKVNYTWSEHTLFNYSTSMPLSTATVFTAQVAPMFGTTLRSLSSGGAALAQEKEIVLSVARPHKMAWWLKLETQPLTGGNLIPPFKLDPDLWQQSGTARYYYLPYTSTNPYTFTVRLPLDGVSDGASVTVKAVYAKNLWSEQNSGPPTKPEDEGVLAEFKFKVGSFQIKKMDFLGFELYSGFAKQQIPSLEWVRGVRETPPSTSHWNESISAPAAFKIGEPLTVKVEYDCHGLTSALISATCDDTAFPSPVCEFGDITERAITCAGDTTAVVTSTDATTSISASMNSFTWKVRSSEIIPSLPITNSVHRIYSILGTPESYSQGQPWAWIEFIELASDITSPNIDSCGLARGDILRNYYDHSFGSPLYFIEPHPLGIKYAASGDDYWDRGEFSPTHPFNFSYKFRASLLLTNIETGLVTLDCYGNSMLYSTMTRSIGCDMGLMIIDQQTELVIGGSSSFTTRNIWAKGGDVSAVAIWGAHFVAAKFGQLSVYDPSARLSYFQLTHPECPETPHNIQSCYYHADGVFYPDYLAHLIADYYPLNAVKMGTRPALITEIE